jgi:hypothetical protein
MRLARYASLCVLVAVAAAAGVALTPAGHHLPNAEASKAPHHPARKAQAGGAAPQAELLARFPILGRPRTAGDQIEPGLQPGGMPVAAAAARRVTLPDTRVAAWFAGDGNSLCLTVKSPNGGAGTVCNGTASPAADGFASVLGPDPAGDIIVVGIVPAGVPQVTLHMADGSTRVLQVSDNAYEAIVTEPTDSVTYTDAAGPQVRRVVSYHG